MNPTLYFSMFTMILSIILIVILFVNKKRLIGLDKIIIKILSFIAFGNVLFEVIGVFLGKNYADYELLNDVILRAMLVFYIAWFSVFIIFILNVSRKDKKIFINSKWPLYLIMLACMILTVVLPITAVTNDAGVIIYSTGKAVDIVRYYTLACNFVCLVIMFKNMKNSKISNYSSLFALIILTTIIAVVQTYHPELLLMSFVETFVTYVIYFTIEKKVEGK